MLSFNTKTHCDTIRADLLVTAFMDHKNHLNGAPKHPYTLTPTLQSICQL